MLRDRLNPSIVIVELAEGMARLRQAPLKHGGRSAEARQAARDRSEAREALAVLNALLRGL